MICTDVEEIEICSDAVKPIVVVAAKSAYTFAPSFRAIPEVLMRVCSFAVSPKDKAPAVKLAHTVAPSLICTAVEDILMCSVVVFPSVHVVEVSCPRTVAVPEKNLTPLVGSIVIWLLEALYFPKAAP